MNAIVTAYRRTAIGFAGRGLAFTVTFTCTGMDFDPPAVAVEVTVVLIGLFTFRAVTTDRVIHVAIGTAGITLTTAHGIIDVIT